VIEALRHLMHESTALVVTHDMELARNADEIVVLERGRVIDRGTYEELSERSEEFCTLAGLQQGERPVRKAYASRPGNRVLFYSHNGVGVGHLQRQLDLATAYRERHPDSVVLLASGSHGASMFKIPAGIDYVKLPSLQMVDRYRTWRPRDLALPLRDVIELRAELLQDTVKTVSPDLLVADFMPAGPYGELLPALDQLEHSGGRAVAGFRDVIDDPAFVRELWTEAGTYDVLRRHYTSICVYGDPRTLNFITAYGLDDELASRVRYCGYLGRRNPPANRETAAQDRPFVVATSGGGVDGPALLHAFVRAAARLQPQRGGRWVAVSGPLMADEDHAEIASLAETHRIEVHRVIPELRNTIAEADCVVSMAGYNTVCDIMSYHRRSILVPRARPSREQSLRAQRLDVWGVADVIQADELRPESLADAIENALAAEPAPSSGPVPLGGIESALNVFDDVCECEASAQIGAEGNGYHERPHPDEAVSPELVLVDPKLAQRA
jgi:predicted glycosyltransferase